MTVVYPFPFGLFTGSTTDLCYEELDRAYRMARLLSELFEPGQVNLSFMEGQENKPRFVVMGVRPRGGGTPLCLLLTRDPSLGKWEGVAVGAAEAREPASSWDLLELLRSFGLEFTPAQEAQFRQRAEEILEQED
jgi:hypothetical protein